MNFQEYLNEIDDFDKISRGIWAEMKGQEIVSNSIEPFFTNLWVDEEKLFRLLKSSQDFNTYIFDAKKDFIDSSSRKEEINLKEIPPPKIDNVRVKEKMIETLIIREPELKDLKLQNTFFDRIEGKVWVNTSKGYIDPQKYTHNTYLGIKEKKIELTINIPYRNYNREPTKTIINEVEATINSSDIADAIKIKLSDADDFIETISYLFPHHKDMAQVALVSHFEEVGKGLTLIEDLLFFYNHLPAFALQGTKYKEISKKLSDELLWDHFIQFLNFDSQLHRDVNTVREIAALAVEPFRDKSRYAIRILTAISGEFVYNKIKNDPKLILHIYHSLDGQSVYMGEGIISETNQVAYGQMIDNRELFVVFVTAFMQAQHAMDDAHQSEQKGCLFAFGISKDSDTIERHCELTGDLMDGNPKNMVKLINTVKTWNLKTKEFEHESEIENGEFRPLDMLHLKVYARIKNKNEFENLEIDTEVPALLLYHIAQRKAFEDALRMLRIAADLVIIGVSAFTIASGVSGLPLYVAVVDLTFAISDTYIEQNLRDELKMTPKGRELLDAWDSIYMIQGATSFTATAMAGMLPKAQKALDVTVEVLYKSRFPSQEKSITKLIENTLYSFPLRDYSKAGVKVLLKDGIKNVTKHSSDFEKLNILFVENAEKEIAVLYKGKKFFHANSAGRTGKFLDYLYKKAGGNIAKLEREISRTAGMAENVMPSISMTVEEFKAGWKALQEAIQEGKITAENALDYIYDVLPYFNHHIVNNELKVISDSNCVNVVQKVIEYLETGKISQALHSEGQEVILLENIFGNKFSSPVKITDIRTIDITEGEIGIMYVYREGFKRGHVFNVIKKNKRFMLLNGQKGIMQTLREYEFIEYLKVK
ncbi:hypothetical protein [Chryseobacterium aquaticum]|uniref:Uncharacterized protein n=1 Tax=Chryseobacterium aquaticum subsp. greenlandense TaxID=345663 RepID=A0A124F3F6_9FLAO|nr:hypothetical protein [Chryseobacterium aquaticum]KUJ57794.1 hypothetical protein AR686_03300 [Chryseobacterium aquaticum subsp. greenlandense]